MTFASKDSTLPLRFAPPEDPPPFGAQTLRLRQLDVRRLDDAGARVMSCLSEYRDRWEANTDSDIADAKRMLAELGAPGYEVRTDALPNRRFSGDGLLSRSRYYSVCQEDGSDGGAMRREVAAYHDPMTRGLIEIEDVAVPDENSRRTSASDAAVLSLRVTIPPFTSIQHEALRDLTSEWETTYVLLPVTTGEQRFNRLIDLRDPAAARWFTRSLTRLRWVTGDGTLERAFPNKRPLDDFVDLLPALTTQIQGGGNAACRIAGQWLRSLGADALVFPSARSNASITVEKGVLVGFYGWNLVDYRSAEPARLQTFDLGPTWPDRLSHDVDEPPLPIYAGVTLDFSSSGATAGSWSWRGIEEANHAARLLGSALHLHGLAVPNASDDERRELGLMLGATDTVEALSETSGWFVRAMLGDERVRRAWSDSATVEPGRPERPSIDFDEIFGQMDARIAAAKAGDDW